MSNGAVLLGGGKGVLRTGGSYDSLTCGFVCPMCGVAVALESVATAGGEVYTGRCQSPDGTPGHPDAHPALRFVVAAGGMTEQGAPSGPWMCDVWHKGRKVLEVDTADGGVDFVLVEPPVKPKTPGPARRVEKDSSLGMDVVWVG